MTDSGLFGWVRIRTGVNDAIRCTVSSVTSTFTLTAGSYWIGRDGDGGGGDDSTFPHGVSLLEHIATVTGLSFRLQTLDALTITDAATGYVYASAPQAGDAIIFDSPSTIDPLWLGRNKSSGAYGTHTFTNGSTFENISRVSSSLAYHDAVDVVQDIMRTKILESKAMADSGRQETRYLGEIIGRLLRFKHFGIPRSDSDGPDTTYHAMRRFRLACKRGMAGDRFLYSPDLTEMAGSVWDPDDETLGYRFGTQDMVFGEEMGPLEPEQAQEDYWRVWFHGFTCHKYIT